MSDVEFVPWPKTPRLFRDCVITEKIDGTNAGLHITPERAIYAQSRNRMIQPGKTTDNAGFAQWAADNAGTLFDDLGPGLHYGEWWGNGIQRGYGLPEGDKRFSLFNANRFEPVASDFYTQGLGVVPVIARGTFSTILADWSLELLISNGSKAAPGFMRPEGVVVYHTASRQVFKALIENDEAPKGQAA
jgi:hypothetical protein